MGGRRGHGGHEKQEGGVPSLKKQSKGRATPARDLPHAFGGAHQSWGVLAVGRAPADRRANAWADVEVMAGMKNRRGAYRA